jgi:hypothetical protein
MIAIRRENTIDVIRRCRFSATLGSRLRATTRSADGFAATLGYSLRATGDHGPPEGGHYVCHYQASALG